MNFEAFMGREDERPLDSYPADGGFVGIFRTIACVGDSLASGEFEAINMTINNRMWLDRYDYSWGQYLARMAGCQVYNFSRGGMTAKEYNQTFGNNMGYFRPELAANAYVIALGVNDLFGRNDPLGTTTDICLDDWRKNADTFAGNYAAIIQRYRKIRPEAVFFLVNLPYPQSSEEKVKLADAHDALLRELTEMFPNTYLIDLRNYGPAYDEEFKKKYYLGGHMAPTGYLLTAKLILSYIDYIIRKNPADFRFVGLQGFEFADLNSDHKNFLP